MHACFQLTCLLHATARNIPFRNNHYCRAVLQHRAPCAQPLALSLPASSCTQFNNDFDSDSSRAPSAGHTERIYYGHCTGFCGCVEPAASSSSSVAASSKQQHSDSILALIPPLRLPPHFCFTAIFSTAESPGNKRPARLHLVHL